MNTIRTDRLHLVLLLALTFSTGIIDAIGFLSLDRVFTGNMTGNVVILGMGLVGADGLPTVGPSIALCGFVTGAVVGGRVLRYRPAGWSLRTTTVIAGVGATIVAIAVLVVAQSPTLEATQLIATGALGTAMGAQAATARHIAVPEVTTVVITSTLTGLAADSLLGANGTQPWGRRVSAVALIGLGAVTGAATVAIHPGFGLLLSGVITLAVAYLGHRVCRTTTEERVSGG